MQTKTSLEKIARGLAVLAGTLDTVTGAGLVFVPALMLRLMLVGPVDAGAETFLRFTGVFVALVGGSYLWALRRGRRELRVVFALTAWSRLAAGAFCSWAIMTGRLPPAWGSVPATDFILAAVQAWLLQRGVFRDEN